MGTRVTYFFLLTATLLLLCPPMLYPQHRYTLNGHITDRQTGEALTGAYIYIPSIGKGSTTNIYGFYSLTLPGGEHTIEYSYIGYQTQNHTIVLDDNMTMNIELMPEERMMNEIVVPGTAADKNVRLPEMSVSRINVKEIRSVPVIFGEQDVLKTLQLLPGIKAAGEGLSGFHVRGSDAGQNLVILDEAPVYNATHLLGFFSVFNSDAVKDVAVYKGGIPAEYGGRLASVIDVKMKEGNLKNAGVTGGLGLISSRLLVECPFKKDMGSFMAAGRRTYADLFLKLSPDTMLNNNKLYFYDLNLKGNYRLGNNDRLFLSGYFGRDVFEFRNMIGFDWGNAAAALRWNHLFNHRLFVNSTLLFSRYNYRFTLAYGGNKLRLISSIRDINWQEDFQYFFSTGSTLKFGLETILHRVNPGEVTAVIDFPVNKTKLGRKHALEQGIYVSHEWDVNPWFSVVYGLRYSLITALGPGNVYSFDERGEVVDTTRYTKWERIKCWGGWEPRVLINVRTSPSSSVKASFTRSLQYMHLLSNSTASTPVDLWIPSSAIIKPQHASQFALGYFRNLHDNRYETSLELYYKDMRNQIEYRNGADLFLNELVESQLVFGSGRSYGAEFLVRKNQGRLHGWAGYTLSRTERRFDQINNGKPFPARQDRTHDVSLVGMFDLNNRLSFSAIWVFSTGEAVTFPSGKYIMEGQVINYYTERNGYRMPPYHRLDLGITLNGKPGKKYQSNLNLSVYNLYARKNAFTIMFEQDEEDPSVTHAKMIYLFSVIPSLTWNFKF